MSSLRKQVRSKKFMDEVFDALELEARPRYGRLEFAELGAVIDKKYVGGISTQTAIENALNAEPEPEPVEPVEPEEPTEPEGGEEGGEE